MSDTARSVSSPNFSAISQTGTCVPMSPTVPSTARSGVGVMLNGSTSSEPAHSTDIDLRPRRVDRGMQEALGAERPVVLARRRAVERELQDVARLDERGGAIARQQEATRIVRMAHADVSVFVEHAVMRQDPVGDDQIVDRALQCRHQMRMFSCVNATRALHRRDRLRQLGMIAREVQRRVIIFKIDLAARLAVERDEALRFRAVEAGIRIAVVVDQVVLALDPERRRHHHLVRRARSPAAGCLPPCSPRSPSRPC